MTSDWTPVWLSLRVAAVATLVLVPSGVALAWLIARKRPRGRFVLELVVSLPLALPPVVVGYALLSFFGQGSPVGRWLEDTLGLHVVFTWAAAVIASALMAMPLAVRAYMVALAEVDPRLEAASRSLGAGPARTLLTVTLPLARRGLLAGTLLGFVRAFSEFGATIVVAGNIPGQTQTLPLAVFSRVAAGRDEAALRLVIVAVAIAAASLLLHNYLVERARAAERARASEPGPGTPART
ncbi:MAG: molybdate ABC transporter permease subunit [Chloroflexi bacterium]|nr:molybdate ABC transporter permease subunit [Chloroflexota bacterium]